MIDNDISLSIFLVDTPRTSSKALGADRIVIRRKDAANLSATA